MTATSTTTFLESISILILFGSGLTALIYASVVAVQKGKGRLVIVAWLAGIWMVLPTVILLAAAAIRLAKPQSTWAERYDDETMARSIRRFAKPVVILNPTVPGEGTQYVRVD
jgi:hypothetical protein